MKLQISLTLILFSFLGFAQEQPLSLSLQEAIDYALQNNRTAKNAALDIDAAIKRKWETTAIGLPQISAKVDYQNWLEQKVSVADFNGDGIDEVFAFGKTQTIDATATLSQLLFDGSYLVGLQSAKVYLEISKNAKEKTDLEIRKATINAYGNVLLSEESIEIYDSNIAVLKKNVYETQQILENGLTEEENVEQLQITLKQLEIGHKNALRLNAIAYKMLNLTLGADINTEVILKENLENLADKNISLNLLNIEENVTQNIDYKIASNDKRSKELLIKLEKSKNIPTLSTFINGGYTAFNDRFEFLEDEQKWYGSSMFGVSLNIPLFGSFKQRAIIQRAKINLEKANNNLKETEAQLQFQIATSKSNYQFAIENYYTSKENLALAKRIENKNTIKFSEGITSSFDLRQAQTQLYAAQQEYLQAMLGVINNKATLETLLNK